MYEENGNLCVSTSAGIWHWKPGLPKFFPLTALAIHDYQEGLGEYGGRLVFSVDNELRWIREGKIEKYPVPPGFPADPRRLLRDHDGGLWIGTLTHGLFHSHQGEVDKFDRTDGLSGDRIQGVIEDREGNIWVFTTDGLVGVGSQRWQRLDRHARWFEPVERRTGHHLRQGKSRGECALAACHNRDVSD